MATAAAQRKWRDKHRYVKHQLNVMVRRLVHDYLDEIAGRFVDGEEFSVEVVFEDEVDAAELHPPIVEGPPG